MSPGLIRELLKHYDHDEAIGLLTYVVERIDIRLDRAKDRRLKYELACYRSWLMNLRGQIAATNRAEPATGRHTSLMGAVKRIIAGQAHP